MHPYLVGDSLQPAGQPAGQRGGVRSTGRARGDLLNLERAVRPAVLGQPAEKPATLSAEESGEVAPAKSVAVLPVSQVAEVVDPMARSVEAVQSYRLGDSLEPLVQPALQPAIQLVQPVAEPAVTVQLPLHPAEGAERHNVQS